MNQNIKDILEDMKDDEMAVMQEIESLTKTLSFLSTQMISIKENRHRLIRALTENNG